MNEWLRQLINLMKDFDGEYAEAYSEDEQKLVVQRYRDFITKHVEAMELKDLVILHYVTDWTEYMHTEFHEDLKETKD